MASATVIIGVAFTFSGESSHRNTGTTIVERAIRAVASASNGRNFLPPCFREWSRAFQESMRADLMSESQCLSRAMEAKYSDRGPATGLEGQYRLATTRMSSHALREDSLERRNRE